MNRGSSGKQAAETGFSLQAYLRAYAETPALARFGEISTCALSVNLDAVLRVR